MWRSRVSVVVRVVAVSLLAVLSGCGCNLVGCGPALRVHLAVLPAGAFKVELIVNGSIEATRECSIDDRCQQDVFLETSAMSFSVRVVTDTGTRVTNFTGIRYKKSRPNGTGCDPECQLANVTAQIP